MQAKVKAKNRSLRRKKYLIGSLGYKQEVVAQLKEAVRASDEVMACKCKNTKC